MADPSNEPDKPAASPTPDDRPTARNGGDFGSDPSNADREPTIRGDVGRFLTFVGPLIFIAGLLAIWRTGDTLIFYAAMMPIGLIMWLAGFYLYITRPDRPAQADPPDTSARGDFNTERRSDDDAQDTRR